MATTPDRSARFGYAATDPIDVLTSDDPDALASVGASPISTDDDGPSGVHDAALVLAEVLVSAIELAGDLEKDVQGAEVDDTAKRGMVQVAKLLGQASAVMEGVEAALGIAREHQEDDGQQPSATPGATPPIDAIRRALASRRSPSGT